MNVTDSASVSGHEYVCKCLQVWMEATMNVCEWVSAYSASLWSRHHDLCTSWVPEPKLVHRNKYSNKLFYVLWRLPVIILGFREFGPFHLLLSRCRIAGPEILPSVDHLYFLLSHHHRTPFMRIAFRLVAISYVRCRVSCFNAGALLGSLCYLTVIKKP